MPGRPSAPQLADAVREFLEAGVGLASILPPSRRPAEGPDPEPLSSFPTRALFRGLVGRALVPLVLHPPAELRPGGHLELVKVREGVFPTGGVLGGLAAGALF